MTENESTERRQVFVGNIRKCPSCGAQIATDTAKCPSCGFVIEKEKISSAMDEFAKKFVALQSDAEKREFVESYPIPNNKEDLRGFLNYAANQRDKDYPTPANKAFWVDAWNNKCRLIVNQVVDIFGSDAEFMQYIRTYKAEVEKSSSENKKLKGRLCFAKIAKISAVAAVVLALVCVIGWKQKKRAELIAGCVVPKENVSFGNMTDKYNEIEVLSDAKIVTTNISQRNETGVSTYNEGASKNFPWCLDTTVTVEVKFLSNIKESFLERRKKLYPEYYSSPDFNGEVWLRTGGFGEFSENSINCSYQSRSATQHGFDNVHQISETMMNWEEENMTKTLTFRLTQIAGSKQECENLAIKLHKSGEFSFEIKSCYDQKHYNWTNKQ